MSKNKKIKYIIIVILLIIVSYLIYFYQNKFTTYFEIEVSDIYIRAIKAFEANPEIRTYGKLDGVHCNDIELNIQPNTYYYVEFDENGNMIKLYVRNNKKKYIKEGIILEKDMTWSNMEDYISKSRKFKFDCEGNILHK